MNGTMKEMNSFMERLPGQSEEVPDDSAQAVLMPRLVQW
jgi:hypothetical protein